MKRIGIIWQLLLFVSVGLHGGAAGGVIYRGWAHLGVLGRWLKDRAGVVARIWLHGGLILLVI
jgi:hypothetical protein